FPLAPGEHLTMLRHAPLHIVVDYNGDGQIVPYRGIEFGEIESDRAVADHTDDLTIRMGDLGGEREWDANPEAPQIAVAQKSPRLARLERVGHPRRGFTAVRRDDRVGRERLRDFARHPRRMNRAFGLHRLV